jgi:DNA mismatch repair protein MutS
LKKIGDIQRQISRISYGSANPRDVIAFKNTYKSVAKLKQILEQVDLKSELICECRNAIDTLEDIIQEIENTLIEDAPVNPKEGGLIKEGISHELDNLRATAKNAKDWLAALEHKERMRTGIKSLKVGYTDVFGYYIEVTKPNLKLVPSDYIRKQTLVNCERFITPELKEKEALILGAEERTNELEYRIFAELCSKIASCVEKVQRTADAISRIDVFSGFAEVADEHHYVRPDVNTSNTIFIKDGRHPVVENALYPEKDFIPNDTLLDTAENRVIILTGPNMAGKSTYLRQVALITIMAQIGSFVPAKYASLGIVDRIFTRVGAFDDLTLGQSTFMVEMVELANILNNATHRSLILLDEIGRGTSTFDGLSIAWAVAEYLHSKSKHGTKTLFATHYHHLTELATVLDGMKNYHIAVKEDKDDIIFLHKVVPGSTDKSYGIQVAKLAGVPKDVINRANDVLKMIEMHEFALLGDKAKKISKTPRYTQLILFSDTELGLPTHPVIEELKKTDINNMTPLEALSKLCELKKKCEK